MRLGELEIKAHHVAAGQAATRRSIEVYEECFRATDTPAVRQDLVSALLTLSETERGAEASGHLERALQILAPVRALAGSNPGLRGLLQQVDDAVKKARARR
jgi:hypothetical protein